MGHSHRTWLGRAIALILAVALLLAGSVRSWQLLIIHGLALLCLVAAARMPDAALKRSSAVVRLFWIGAGLLATSALGLLFAPAALLRWLSPGRIAALPSADWLTLSSAPEGTMSALFTGSAALVVLVCIAQATGLRGGRSGAERGAVIGTLALVLIAAGHAITGAQSLFGLLPVRYPPAVFWAPLVNPNHTATLLLLGLPVALGQTLANRDTAYGALAAVSATAAAVALIALGSGGAALGLLAMGVAAAVVTRRQYPRLALLLVGGLVASSAAALAVVIALEPGWADSSLLPRITQYRDQPAVFLQHWLFGGGVGAYESTYAPYRTQRVFITFVHAHSEPLQWLVEAGLVGLSAAIVALWARPRVGRDPRARWWLLGLIGAGAQSIVAAPLHVPAVLLIATASLGTYLGGFSRHTPTEPKRVRRYFYLLAATQVLAMGWRAADVVVQRNLPAAQRVTDAPDDAVAAANAVRWLAPWRPEPDLVDAWMLTGQRRAQAAEQLALDFEDDADTLRRAAMLLLSVDRRPQALTALHRSIQRSPTDYRAYVVLARATRSEDPQSSAHAWADAIVRWPWQAEQGWDALQEGYHAFPVGLYWVDALDDAGAPWLLTLGHLLRADQDFSAALLAYERAGERYPQTRWAPQRALALDGIGDRDGAERWLASAEAFNRKDVAYYWIRGELQLKWGLPQEALDSYLRGLTLLPNDPRSSERVMTAAIAVSPQRAVEVATQLQSTRHLGHPAALRAARQAHSLRQYTVCSELLRDIHLVDSALGDEARLLWAACAAQCEDCAVFPD